MPSSTTERSHELTASPWQDAEPLAALRRGDYRLAFQVSATPPLLRTVDDVTRPVGVQRGPWRAYDPLPRPEEHKPAEAIVRKEKVVDPAGPRPAKAFYRNLAGVLATRSRAT